VRPPAPSVSEQASHVIRVAVFVLMWQAALNGVEAFSAMMKANKSGRNERYVITPPYKPA